MATDSNQVRRLWRLIESGDFTGAVQKIAVGKEPHGLTVWPQPGRYSLGHTGNMR